MEYFMAVEIQLIFIQRLMKIHLKDRQLMMI